jgi:anti-anti-sigma regulatory factor
MMRMNVQFAEKVIRIRLEGRLAEQWAEELQKLAVRAIGSRGPDANIEVNLTEVSHLDSRGEEVLKWLSRLGARFVAESASSQWLCERIGLLYELPSKKIV